MTVIDYDAIAEATANYQRLVDEVKRLRAEVVEERSLRVALEESISDAGPSWLQSKNMAQRKALRLLNQSVRAQRIVLRLINKNNLGPTLDEIHAAFNEVAEKEKLDQESLELALNHMS